MVSKKNLCMLPNGIDVEKWQPDPEVRKKLRDALGITDEFLWLAVGRLEPVKDYPTLLQSMAKTKERSQLVILGDGPQLGQLLKLSERLGLLRRVRFLGFDSNVRPWMQAADGLVLASRYEGLPMVVLEAGACGAPTVATNVAGIREVIVNGETGWLACASGADALAAVMARLMRAPESERHAMGDRAREFVVKQFSLESVLDRWEELYAELLGRREMRKNRLRTREALTRQSATHA
jgi:glycosyltransferase involved in cell wall biosynthesis